MAQVPSYRQQQLEVSPLPGPRADASYRKSPWEVVGEELSGVATIFRKMQDASDAAEAGRLVRETSAELQKAVKQTAIEYSDPTEFETVAKERMEEIRRLRLESASNSRVRQHLLNNIGDDMLNRQSDIEVTKFSKLRTKAKADWGTMKIDSVDQYAATEDQVEKTKIVTDLGRTLKELVDANLMDADDKQVELKNITERIAEIDIRSDFKKDPVATIESMDSKYGRRLGPEKLEQIKDHLATHYRVMQADITRRVKEEQDSNFADAMVRARQPGGITQVEIDKMASFDPVTKKRMIDAGQAVHLTNQLQATAAAGGVMYSNPAILSDMQFRLHKGHISPTEVRNAQLGGSLTIGDANQLYNGIEARIRRDRADAREARIEARLNKQEGDDIYKNPDFKRAESYITRALPNTDRLDMDHAFRIIAAQAHVDFDKAARAVGADGKPKYKESDYQTLAENIVEGALQKMDLQQNSARAKLLPGIKTPEDVAKAARSGRISPTEARRQMELLQELGAGAATTVGPSQLSTPPAATAKDRNQAAKDRAKAMGAP